MSGRPRRLLILSPSFHGYELAIAGAFEQVGLEVRTCLYDRFETIRAKARNKLRYELPERLGRSTTAMQAREAGERAGRAIDQADADLVLVIKGDVLGDPVWDRLEARGTPSVLWLYDELRRTRWDQQQLTRPGRVASYSAADVAQLRAEGLAAEHVPLGFDSMCPIPETTRSGEVTFIGARYPGRELMLTALQAEGVDVRAYGRTWSHDLRDRLRTWGEARPDLPAGRDVDRSQAYGIMRASAATLNIHGDQDGFTMRTFEAAGVGAVQVCDRPDVECFYTPGEEVLVAEDPAAMIEQVHRVVRDPAWSERLRERARGRTLAHHTLVHRARALQALFA